MQKIAACVALALLVCSATAASIKWTGYGDDNQWTNRLNWNPDQVPSTGDDVEIREGVVLVTIPTGVNSLVMGNSFSNPANITFYQAFYVGSGGMTVEGNGNVFINSGTANVVGTINIAGALYFQSGTVGGTWTVNSKGTADLSGLAQKAFVACQFSCAGQFTLGGVVALNQSSQVVVSSNAMLSGDVSIQNQDGSNVLFDTSAGTLTYSGGGTFQIEAAMNIGTFNFQAGNLSIYDDISFTNNFVIPSSSVVATIGSASVNMSAGVSGSGVLSVAGVNLLVGTVNISGQVQLVGGNLTFTASGSSISSFSITGGYGVFNYPVSIASAALQNGNVVGAGGMMIQNGWLNSQGFNWNTPVTVNGAFSVSVASLISFGPSGSLTVASGAQLNVGASLQLTGNPGETVTNNGAINANSPLAFQNINLGGTGTLNVASTVQVSSITLTQSTVNLQAGGVFKGSNTMITSISQVTGSPAVCVTIGDYSFSCPGACDGISTSTAPPDNFHFRACSGVSKKH